MIDYKIIEEIINSHDFVRTKELIEDLYNQNKLSFEQKEFYISLISLKSEPSYKDLFEINLNEARKKTLEKVSLLSTSVKHSNTIKKYLWAASVAAIIFISGFISSYLLFDKSSSFNPYIVKINSLEIDTLTGAYSINADLIYKNAALKGSINDKNFIDLCVKCLSSERNAGVRLSLVEALKKTSDKLISNRDDLKKVLINLLLNDPNPRIRLDVLELVSKFPIDMEIKKAVASSFLNDENAAVRIAALNLLEIIALEKNIDESIIIQSLKQKLQGKDNAYVINRTKILLEKIDVK